MLNGNKSGKSIQEVRQKVEEKYGGGKYGQATPTPAV
ncbi:MAG: hypothetical protein IBX61_06175 [Thermoleophilia bacterium]|nr:hypothetical protein [Thermoleophilia bacterium]